MLDTWTAHLEERHLADLTFQEVRKGVQAISQTYIQRRENVSKIFSGRGKQAAFALYYGLLHFHAVRRVVEHLELPPPKKTLVDLGCGTGVGSAAWALGTSTQLFGVDLNAWALREAGWNWKTLGLTGKTLKKDLRRYVIPAGASVIAAYSLNELPEHARHDTLKTLAAHDGPFVLVEPLARELVPWWSEAVDALGGDSHELKLAWDKPSIVAKLDKATGLRHDRIKVRCLVRV